MFEVVGPDDSSVQRKYEVNGKNTTDLEHKDEFEENCMIVYVKTISGKTIRIKCDKKQQADIVSNKILNENSDSSRNNLPHPPRKMLKNKKTT